MDTSLVEEFLYILMKRCNDRFIINGVENYSAAFYHCKDGMMECYFINRDRPAMAIISIPLRVPTIASLIISDHCGVNSPEGNVLRVGQKVW